MKTYWNRSIMGCLAVSMFILILTPNTFANDPTSHPQLIVDDEIAVAEMLIKSSEILNDLKRSKGMLPTEAPFLEIKTPTGHKIAATYIDEEKILLDPEAYRICEAMKRIKPRHFENALAYILGHEFGHYLKNHGDQNELISEAVLGVEERLNSSRSSAFAVNSANNQIVSEAVGDFHRAEDEGEADLEGAILGYLAGYDTAEAGKAFLGFAYDQLDISENSSKYPSLSQRQNLIDQTAAELQKLVPLFEMANYLVAIEQYEDAIPYLERILPKFQSREIYNNIGVMYLLETLRLFAKPLTDYRFPLTLDSEFRAPHPFSGQIFEALPSPRFDGWIKDFPCQLTEIQLQVNVAKQYFKKAIHIDHDYSTAYLNLSIAETINYLLFDKNEAECMENKREELDKALGNVYEAKSKLWELMHGDTILSYPYTPEEADRFQISIDTIITSDSDTAFSISVREHDTVDPMSGWDSLRAPFKKIYVGEVVLTEMTQLNRMPAYTVASNSGNSGAEQRKVQLSHIWTQIDIIEILMGKLKNQKIEVRGEFDNQIKRSPFFKALSLHPNNLLALHNRNVARGIQDEDNNSTTTTLVICEIDRPISNQSLEQIYDSIDNWQEFELKKSKLISFIKRSDGPVKSFQPMEQSMQYQRKDSFHIYANTTEMDIDRRVEKSIVAAPIHFDNVSTMCQDSIGTEMSELEKRHGEPSRFITLTGGSYVVYDLKEEKSEVAGVFNVPSRIEQSTRGIIYKLDYNNEVAGWAYFDRMVKTEAVDN